MPGTEPTGRPHRNHGLFSDHYLNVTLPGRADWAALSGEAEEAMAVVSRVLGELAAGAFSGFGRAVDAVLDLDEAEREQLFGAFVADFDDRLRAARPGAAR